jgi:hypothetical protein
VHGEFVNYAAGAGFFTSCPATCRTGVRRRSGTASDFSSREHRQSHFGVPYFISERSREAFL